jgi:hypothetical protein
MKSLALFACTVLQSSEISLAQAPPLKTVPFKWLIG